MYQCIIWQPCDSLEIKQSAGFSLLYVVAVVVALQKCSPNTSVGAKIKFLQSNISLHRSQLSVHYMTDMWHFCDTFTWTREKWRDDDWAVKRPLSCVRFLSLSMFTKHDQSIRSRWQISSLTEKHQRCQNIRDCQILAAKSSRIRSIWHTVTHGAICFRNIDISLESTQNSNSKRYNYI